MRRCPKRRWRVRSITALVERYQDLVLQVRFARPPSLCYERAAVRVQTDIYQSPELNTFDLIDELVSLERFLRQVRARLGAQTFDAWFALRILQWKPKAVVEEALSPWALSTLYTRIQDGWLDEIDAHVCTELVHAGWWDFDARMDREAETTTTMHD